MIIYQVLCLIISLAAVATFFLIDFKIPLNVLRLESSTHLYSDRPYSIQDNYHLIDNAFVVRIPRHLRTPVYVSTTSESAIYRLLSDVNSNEEFGRWQQDTNPIHAPGSDYVGNENHLTRAVFCEFGPGMSKLPPGGPRFTAPILVETNGEVVAHTVRFFNKIIGPPSRNKKKLLGATAFVVIANAVAFGLRYAIR